MEYIIRRYTDADKATWNEFIADACNATFLFNRDFMEYHQDRFPDFSLIILHQNKWMAVLPAHRHNDVVFSHFGLTYGGLLYGVKKLADVVVMLGNLLQYLQEQGVRSLQLKTTPAIYHKNPAGEFDFALMLAKAKITRRDALHVLDLRQKLAVKKTRLESIRRGKKQNLVIREEANFKDFWELLLLPNLSKRHQTNPVHSLQEITMLHERFPIHIRHFNVYHQNTLVAGSTVFVTDRVAHPQYLAGQDDRHALGCIDFLYYHLITQVFQDKLFFDFGISQENGGCKLNTGLAFWKESYGAGVILQDFYTIETGNFSLLTDFQV